MSLSIISLGFIPIFFVITLLAITTPFLSNIVDLNSLFEENSFFIIFVLPRKMVFNEKMIKIKKKIKNIKATRLKEIVKLLNFFL